MAGTGYGQVLDVLAAALDGPGWESPLGPLCAALAASTRSGIGSFTEVRADPPSVRIVSWPDEQDQLPLGAMLAASIPEHPMLQHYLPGSRVDVLRVTDLTSEHTWRHSSLRSTIHEVCGVDQIVLMPLASSPGVVAGFSLGRDATDYSDHEVDVLTDLQRITGATLRRVGVLQRWSAEIDPGDARAGRSAADQAGLTVRETAVLAELVDGRTAAAIARRLDISPRTVTKHLEHVYRKLGVRDRVSAVIAAQRLGLAPVPAQRGRRDRAVGQP